MVAQVLGATIAMGLGFIWYVYIGMVAPFLFMGALFVWYAVKGHMVPPKYTASEAWKIGASSDTSDARFIRKCYTMWFLIIANSLCWAVVTFSTIIVIKLTKAN